MRSSVSRSRPRLRKSRGERSKYSLFRENSSRSVKGKPKKRGSSLKIEEKWREWRWKGLLRRNNAKSRWSSFKTSSWKNEGSRSSFTNKP